jgi:hypothetical protein
MYVFVCNSGARAQALVKVLNKYTDEYNDAVCLGMYGLDEDMLNEAVKIYAFENVHKEKISEKIGDHEKVEVLGLSRAKCLIPGMMDRFVKNKFL